MALPPGNSTQHQFSDQKSSRQLGPVDGAFPPVPPNRPMPPPSSPPTYPPRTHHAPTALPPPTPTSATSRDLPPPNSFNTRPGSSMSISAMLGSEPERSQRERPPSRTSYPLPSINQGQGPVPAYQTDSRSPIRTLSKQPSSEIQFGQRPPSPDRFGPFSLNGPRPHRSSSGGAATFARSSFEDSYHASTPKASVPRFSDFPLTLQSPDFQRRPIDGVDSHRRSSVSGPLQRPSTPPLLAQNQQQIPPSVSSQYSKNILLHDSHRHERDSLSARRDTENHQRRSESTPRDEPARDIFRNMGPNLNYNSSRSGPTQISQLSIGHRDSERPKAFNPWDIQRSPEARRQFSQEHVSIPPYDYPSRSEISHPEAFASYPSGSLKSDQTPHSERHAFSERQEQSKPRTYSPFSAAYGSQQQQYNFGAVDEPQRKLSEDVAQHRSILNLAAENKRGGRASPVPQAVQGAQAQFVGPETTIKSESGRVFSGIGGGFSTITAGPVRTDTPSVLSASPFRREDAGSRSLIDEAGSKVARTSSGIGKRGRKARDEALRLDSEPPEGRHTPIAGRVSGSKKTRHHPTYQRTNIKIRSIIDAVSDRPRRHLGSHCYQPVFSIPDHTPPFSKQKVGLNIDPALFPPYSDEAQLNCTYTIRVSREWLRRDIQEAICRRRFLWGSGVYTDDSDPIAAAIHSGFLKATWPDGVDPELLENIIQEQNPTIDFAENVPTSPMTLPPYMDLHITLLVLPTLEGYESTSRFGIKSRNWPEEENGARHDGVSFAVLNCKLVDEGSSRGEERSGWARRERLREKLKQHHQNVPQVEASQLLQERIPST
ncbi:MAG: hypothetical protein Q9227_000950 [Pyrenula ochraceoflavens]